MSSFDDDDPFGDDPYDGDFGMCEMDVEEEEKTVGFDADVLRRIGSEHKTINGNLYWTRSPLEMMNFVQTIASQLSDHLNLTYAQVWALLGKYDYNPRKVLSKYEQDFDELQKILDECGGNDEDLYMYPGYEEEDGTSKEDEEEEGDKILECPVCYDDKPKSDFITRRELRCGHTNICTTCFGNYIVQGAKDREGEFFDKLSVLKLKCPMAKCSCPLTTQTIERYVRDIFFHES
jgi:hypothetical protein